MRQGRSQAYIDYHWKHRSVWFPTLHGGRSLLGLCGLRMLQRLLAIAIRSSAAARPAGCGAGRITSR